MASSIPNTTQFTASGKLMLFGEYLVLAGSKCLALPLKFGQSMEVTPCNNEIVWNSISLEGEWFNCILNSDLAIIETNSQLAAKRLQAIFRDIKRMAPDLSLLNNFNITANFNMNWGLGSSSTFISLISQWANVDPYELQLTHFGGSGYDIAAASEEVLFSYSTEQKVIKRAKLNELITSNILFVYYGKKQNTREEISNFNKDMVTKSDIAAMNNLIDKACTTDSISIFEELMVESENLLSPLLRRQALKETTFKDYDYQIKSLGAWGGDFFMATYRDVDVAKKYFKTKGYTIQFTYKEIAK